MESSDFRLTQQHRPAGLVGLLEFFHLAAKDGANLSLACIIALTKPLQYTEISLGSPSTGVADYDDRHCLSLR